MVRERSSIHVLSLTCRQRDRNNGRQLRFISRCMLRSCTFRIPKKKEHEEEKNSSRGFFSSILDPIDLWIETIRRIGYVGSSFDVRNNSRHSRNESKVTEGRRRILNTTGRGRNNDARSPRARPVSHDGRYSDSRGMRSKEVPRMYRNLFIDRKRWLRTCRFVGRFVRHRF